MLVVKASNRGQIVIPKNIRSQLNIVPGKKLAIKVEGDHAIIRPLPDDPVEAFCGIFKSGTSLTKALIEERQKDKERESKKVAR